MKDSPRQLLGVMLVVRGVISPEQLAKALALQSKKYWSRTKIGGILVVKGAASREDVNRVLAEQTGGQAEINDLEQTINLGRALRDLHQWTTRRNSLREFRRYCFRSYFML